MVNKLFYCFCYCAMDLIYRSITIYLRYVISKMFCPASLPTYLPEIALLSLQVILKICVLNMKILNFLRNIWLVTSFTFRPFCMLERFLC
jgi:hypothetical protein